MERPFVYVNMAMTADGKITSAEREYPKFTTAEDRERMDRLRAEADALLVGAGTIRADDPKLHVRSGKMREHRRDLGKPPELTRVLASRSLDLPLDTRFFADDGARRIIGTVEDAPSGSLERIAPHAEIWKSGTGQLDFGALFVRLRREGVDRLLVEGGAELNWSLLDADLIDELYLTIAPSLLGGRAAPTPVEGEGCPMAAQRRLRLVEVDRVDDELFTRWAVRR